MSMFSEDFENGIFHFCQYLEDRRKELAEKRHQAWENSDSGEYNYYGSRETEIEKIIEKAKEHLPTASSNFEYFKKKFNK